MEIKINETNREAITTALAEEIASNCTSKQIASAKRAAVKLAR